MKRWTTYPLITFLSFLIPVTQVAGQDASTQVTCPHCSAQFSTSRSGNPDFRSQTIAGTIGSIRQTNVRSRSGARNRHLLVQMRLQNGRQASVDLGPIQNLSHISLQRGDFVRIQGQPLQINGRSVFVARQINAGGQTVSIRPQTSQFDRFTQQRPNGQRQRPSGFDQPSSSSRQPQTSRSASSQQTLSGTIEGFRQVNLRNALGQRDQQALVKIKTTAGRSVVVNLGPKRNLDRISLTKGERIQVRGQRGTVDGRQVFMANQVRADGQTIQISRATQGQQARNFTIQGIVEGYQLTTVGTGTNQVALLRLRLRDGRSIFLDAGQQYTSGEFKLKDLNLLDRVTLEGQRKNVQGREVLVVSRLQYTDTQATGGTGSGTRTHKQEGSSPRKGSSTGQSSPSSSSPYSTGQGSASGQSSSSGTGSATGQGSSSSSSQKQSTTPPSSTP